VTVVSSMGEGRPEPIHLHTKHVADGIVHVVRGTEMIVQSTTADFVKDSIRFLKTSGAHPDTSVTILGICGNTAYSGALKHT
jgi:hypothetical protein